MNSGRAKAHNAFSSMELLACLAAMALLIALIVPALANSISQGSRAVCFNNLRQIGVGYAHFGLEHEQRMAWAVPLADGGNSDHPLKNNVFVQFSIISNFVASPRVLIDPSDDRGNARRATSWGNDSQGGLFHVNFGNNAVSYFFGLDGDFTTPQSLLAGDRNLSHSGFSGCSSRVGPAANPNGWDTITAWTNAVHGLSGNLLFFHGGIDEADTTALRRALITEDIPGSSGRTSYHILPSL